MSLIPYVADLSEVRKSEWERVYRDIDRVSYCGASQNPGEPLIGFMLEEGQRLEELVQLPTGFRVRVKY